MIKNARQENRPSSLEWRFKEYEKYERGKLWYLIAITIGGAIVIYSILAANFLFALIAIMAGITLVINHHHEPRDIHFTINYRGIKVNNKEYPYKELKNFWIIYEPPTVKNLYFVFKSSLRPRLSIPLLDQNPIEVKNLLNLYLKEDLEQENEPLSESLSRLLKI